jgi:hypothetical protein
MCEETLSDKIIDVATGNCHEEDWDSGILVNDVKEFIQKLKKDYLFDTIPMTLNDIEKIRNKIDKLAGDKLK